MEQWLKQVPSEIGYYLAGFVDGEGSFNLSVRKGEGYRYGWQLGLSFNVSQRDITNLLTLKEVLGCGIIKKRFDGVYSLDITKPSNITLKVIPFFRRFPFRSEKATKNFAIFCKIAALMNLGSHKRIEGFKKILSIRETLNQGAGRTRKYTESFVLKSILEKSSETIRQDPDNIGI